MVSSGLLSITIFWVLLADRLVRCRSARPTDAGIALSSPETAGQSIRRYSE